MDKKKLLSLLTVSVLSVYVLSRVDNAGAAGPSDATVVPPPTSLQIRLLDTTVTQPSAAQLTAIQNGTFTADAANQCPASLNCGNPNASLAGTGTCPDVCWVKAANPASPSATIPYNYTQCPSGYAALTTDKADFLYAYTADSTLNPSSTDDMAKYTTQGYTCSLDDSTDASACPSSYSTGDTFTSSGRLYYVYSTDCKSDAGGVSYCDWGVSCGVIHTIKAKYKAYTCTRTGGYYPVPTQYSIAPNITYYQMAPQAIICGHVNTRWVDSP